MADKPAEKIATTNASAQEYVHHNGQEHSHKQGNDKKNEQPLRHTHSGGERPHKHEENVQPKLQNQEQRKQR